MKQITTRVAKQNMGDGVRYRFSVHGYPLGVKDLGKIHEEFDSIRLILPKTYTDSDRDSVIDYLKPRIAISLRKKIEVVQ